MPTLVRKQTARATRLVLRELYRLFWCGSAGLTHTTCLKNEPRLLLHGWTLAVFFQFEPWCIDDVLVRREMVKVAIAAESANLHPIPRLPAEVIEDRLAEWRRLLRGSTTQGRTVLQRILRGRLTFTPRQNALTGQPDGYDFEGPTRFDKLFTGIAVAMPDHIKASKSRRGFEDTTPEDTFDGDYGRLLDQAAQTAREGWRPRGEIQTCISA